MNYRLLNQDEWHRLEPLIPAEFLPQPEIATAAIAEDENGIQGVLFLQLQLHMEPLILRSPVVSFMRLFQVLDEAVAGQTGLVYFAFAADEKIARMTELVGMTKLPYTVWSKEVR